MTKRWLMIFFVVAACYPARGTAGSYGTELPFAAGHGGRASGLGLAATGLTGSPSLQFYNPATLADLQYREAEFFRTTFFDSKSAYHTLSYAHPTLDYGALGISVLRLDVGGIEQRDVNNMLLDPDLSNSQTRVLLGYAISVQSFLSAGVNLKIDNQSFGGKSGSGVGLDIGFLATKTFTEPWLFETVRGGLSIQNLVEPSVKLDQDDVADPMNIGFGVSGMARYGEFDFVTAVDLVNPRYSPTRLRFGQEVGYLDMFAFRVGFDGTTPTYGVGAEYRNVSVDYAFRDEDLGANHRFSVSIRFGAPLSQKREEERARLEAEMERQISTKLNAMENIQLKTTLARADSLFDAGNFEPASRQYELALLWDASNDHAQKRIDECQFHDAVARGRSLIVERDYLQALYQLKRALRLRPGDPTATALVAECDQRIQANEDRNTMVNRMLRRSIDLYASRHFVEALAGFNEILSIAPDNALAAEYKHKSSVNIQNLKESLILESQSFADKHDYASAISSLEQARAYDRNDSRINDRLAELRKRQKEALAKPPVETTPRVTAHEVTRSPAEIARLEVSYKSGLERFEKGDFDLAVRHFMEVWTSAPDFRNVTELLTKGYLFMGMSYYSEEKYRDAIRVWEKALTIDPDNAKARRYLLKAREESNRLSRVEDNGR